MSAASVGRSCETQINHCIREVRPKRSMTRDSKLKRSTGRVHRYFLIWGFVCFRFASRPARSSSLAATISTYGGRCIICGSPRYACCRLPSFSSFFEHGFTPQGSRTLIQVTVQSVFALHCPVGRGASLCCAAGGQKGLARSTEGGGDIRQASHGRVY